MLKIFALILPLLLAPCALVKAQTAAPRDTSKARGAAREGMRQHGNFARYLEKQAPGHFRSEVSIYDRWTREHRRIDAVDKANRPIELKPRTESGIRRGEKQLQRYGDLLGSKSAWLVTYEITSDGRTVYRWREVEIAERHRAETARREGQARERARAARRSETERRRSRSAERGGR